MSAPTKEYLAAYREANRDKLRAQQIERDRKKREAMEANPELRKEYLAKRRQEYLKTHPDAETRESITKRVSATRTLGAGVRIDSTVGGVALRTCDSCQKPKILDEFPRHGKHGRKGTCKECSKPVPAVTKAKPKAKVELPVFVVTTEPKEAPVVFKTAWDAKLLEEGWVKVLGHTDTSEWIKAYVRSGVIMFARGQLGSYSAGKMTFGVLFDDSGKRYPIYGAAEKVAVKIGWPKVDMRTQGQREEDEAMEELETWLDDSSLEKDIEKLEMMA